MFFFVQYFVDSTGVIFELNQTSIKYVVSNEETSRVIRSKWNTFILIKQFR